MENPQVPTLVRQLRRKLGLTQEQLARRIGVTYSTVNHWENGKRRPQPFLMARLLELHATAGADSPPADEAGTSGASGDVPREIREMVDRIVERFDPERVILFGSHARGNAGADSDVDLLVVMDVKGSRRRAQLEVRRALHDIPMPKDVIVTTPTDFAWRREVPGTVERPAAREGKVLHVRR